VNDSIQHALESRLTLASTIGKYIDHMLESNLTRPCSSRSIRLPMSSRWL
jgi:hypothetical protein